MSFHHRRFALAAGAVVLAALGACGRSQPQTRVLGETTERATAPTTSSSPATTAAPTITTTIDVAPTTATALALEPTRAAPPTTFAPLPAPVIEVVYAVPQGSTATAAIDGPSGHLERVIENGGAIFDGLEEGVYAVSVSVDTPTPPADQTGDNAGPSYANARGNIEVHAGDHAVISCGGYADCNGLL